MLDLVCSEMSKICYQYCCIVEIFQFYRLDHDRLVGTFDFMKLVFENYSFVEGFYLESSFIKVHKTYYLFYFSLFLQGNRNPGNYSWEIF